MVTTCIGTAPLSLPSNAESETVLLPCLLGGLGPTPASQQLNLTWVGPSRRAVLTVQVSYRYPRLQEGPDVDWGQLIDNISKQENMTVVCRWEGDPGGHRMVRIEQHTTDLGCYEGGLRGWWGEGSRGGAEDTNGETWEGKTREGKAVQREGNGKLILWQI